jgi:hypothetical protein
MPSRLEERVQGFKKSSRFKIQDSRFQEGFKDKNDCVRHEAISGRQKKEF